MRMSRGITRSRANGNGMSAMESIADMPSQGEIATDRSVTPLHHGTSPVEQIQSSASDGTRARQSGARSHRPRACARRTRAAARPTSAGSARRTTRARAPSHQSRTGVSVLEPAPRRRHVRLALLASAAGVIALGVLLTLVVGREGRPARDAQQTQSVATAVSPPKRPPSRDAQHPRTVKPSKPAGTSTTPATPPPSHATAVPGQTFVWVAAPDAVAYEFQLFQGGERVYRARVQEARLELPGRWRQDGRPHALLPGSYRWYVWMISKRTKQQSAKPTVSAKLVVAKQAR